MIREAIEIFSVVGIAIQLYRIELALHGILQWIAHVNAVRLNEGKQV